MKYIFDNLICWKFSGCASHSFLIISDIIPSNMIEIREAKPKDAKSIIVTTYKTWLDSYPNKDLGITASDIRTMFKDRLRKSNIEKLENDIRKKLKNKLFLVALDKNNIIGSCFLLKDSDKNILKTIYVLPRYQRAGVGKMFWQEALNFFNNKNDIEVSVASYNKKAIDFYNKLGFINAGKTLNQKRFVFESGASIPEITMVFKGKKNSNKLLNLLLFRNIT